MLEVIDMVEWPRELTDELNKDTPDLNVVRSLILNIYNATNGTELKYSDVGCVAPEELINWLNKSTIEKNDPVPYKVRSVPYRPLHFSLSSKVSHLSQCTTPGAELDS